MTTRPTFFFDSDSTYVISGGFGGLGRSICRWMVSRGARHLLMLSRFGPIKSVAQTLLAEMKERGVQIEAPACDVADLSALRTALQSCKTMPPIRGCIQGAMVLRVCQKLS